jgi:N-formylglutamate deformylase
MPHGLKSRLVSPWLARKDTDWWVDRLYEFAPDLGATTVRTIVSRTVIDVNRDPSGASLYPGKATTALCPVTTFDGDPLYVTGQIPDQSEIDDRRVRFFDPYHLALKQEIDRLRSRHGAVVLYDAHSIRSRIPRLFDGLLPQFNIGTNAGVTCDTGLSAAVYSVCEKSGLSYVLDGRFKGGWTTRFYGDPDAGVHAIQMELACRGYMDEPVGVPDERNWPPAFDPSQASAIQAVLRGVVEACLSFIQCRKR